MVNLVKARQKAKKKVEPRVREDKLEKFKATVGTAAPVRVEASAAAAVDELEVLTFRIDGEQYAIEVGRVMEIATPRRLTRVPNANPFVRGVMSLRGIVVTIVDVRKRLRHARDGEGEQIIVVNDEGGPIGFDVDRVLRPTRVAREDVDAHPVVHPSEERPAILGVFRQQDALTILLDLDKLLA